MPALELFGNQIAAHASHHIPQGQRYGQQALALGCQHERPERRSR